MSFVRRHSLLSSSICSSTPNPVARKPAQSGAILFVLLAIMFAAALPARADSVCATGRVSLILSTSCTIGDKTFVFGPDAWTGNMSADDVIFTPDASNPDSPGFTLSAAFGRPFPVFSATAGSTVVISTEELDYGVAITNPGPGDAIIGTTVSVTGAAVSWASSTPTTTLDALVDSFLTNGAACSDFPLAGIFAPSGSVQFNTTSSTEDNFVSDGCTNTTAAIGEAQIFLAATDGAVSLSTASYYVDEAASSAVTPEPGTLLMVGSGLLGLGMGLYRRYGAQERNVNDLRKP